MRKRKRKRLSTECERRLHGWRCKSWRILRTMTESRRNQERRREGERERERDGNAVSSRQLLHRSLQIVHARSEKRSESHLTLSSYFEGRTLRLCLYLRVGSDLRSATSLRPGATLLLSGTAGVQTLFLRSS